MKNTGMAYILFACHGYGDISFNMMENKPPISLEGPL
jgi:hypothetical protein